MSSFFRSAFLKTTKTQHTSINKLRTSLSSFHRALSTTQTGTVKFYDRRKQYGFITLDDQPDVDVFTHRNEFVCDVEAARSPYVPYLVRGERVRFETVVDERNNNLQRAVNVTQADGKPLPMFRDDYVKRIETREKTKFGDVVFKVMSSNDPDESWDDKMAQIAAAYDAACDAIEEAKAKVEGIKNQERGETETKMEE